MDATELGRYSELKKNKDGEYLVIYQDKFKRFYEKLDFKSPTNVAWEIQKYVEARKNLGHTTDILVLKSKNNPYAIFSTYTAAPNESEAARLYWSYGITFVIEKMCFDQSYHLKWWEF